MSRNIVMYLTIILFLSIIFSHQCEAQIYKGDKFSAQNEVEMDSLLHILRLNTKADDISNRQEVYNRYRVLLRLKESTKPKRFDRVRDSLDSNGYISVDSLKVFFENSIYLENDPYTELAFDRLWDIEHCKVYVVRKSNTLISYGYEEQVPIAVLLSKAIQKEDFKYLKQCAQGYPKEDGYYIALHLFSKFYSKEDYRIILEKDILSISDLAQWIVDDIQYHFF